MASELISILLGGALTLSGTFFIHAYRRHVERKRLLLSLKCRNTTYGRVVFSCGTVEGSFR